MINKKFCAGTTLEEIFFLYMNRYSKHNNKTWKSDEHDVPCFLGQLFPNMKFKSSMKKLDKKNGLYQANRLLDRIKAIYNKAIEWGSGGANPAHGIKKLRKSHEIDSFMPLLSLAV